MFLNNCLGWWDQLHVVFLGEQFLPGNVNILARACYWGRLFHGHFIHNYNIDVEIADSSSIVIVIIIIRIIIIIIILLLL